ncbi:MAG: hypothetical protein IPI02_12615 [Sterolibacteriaceae bacterium]|nr:hypothetical protein [Sterolibacteriaceae bacterium]
MTAKTSKSYSHDAGKDDWNHAWYGYQDRGSREDDDRGDRRGRHRDHDDDDRGKDRDRDEHHHGKGRDHDDDDHGHHSSYCHYPTAEPRVVSVSDSRAVEGNAEIFTVTLSGEVHSRLDVGLTLAAGSATLGSDFRSALEVSFDGGCNWSNVQCSTVKLAAGTEDFLVRVATIDDKLVESTESFTLTAAANKSSATGTGIIEDNDTPAVSPTVVSVGDASTEEGGMAVFTVKLSEAGAAATAVQLALLAGSASAGDDYGNALEASFDGGTTWSAVAGAAVSVPPGNAEFLVRVATIDDLLVEQNETFSLTASAGGASASGSGTIIDNDSALPALTISDAADFEGEPLVFDLAFGSAPITAGIIHLTLADDTATAGADYDNAIEVSRDGGLNWSAIGADGLLSVAAGESALQLRVQTIDDPNPEPQESFTLNASILTGSGSASASGHIFDNDSARIGNPAVSAARPLLAADVLSSDTPLGPTHGGSSAAGVDAQVAAALLPTDDLLRHLATQPVATLYP